MCSIREVGLVSVLYYKTSVNQWLEKQGLLVVRLRLRECSILFTRLMFWSLSYYHLCFFYYIYIFSIITYTSATCYDLKLKGLSNKTTLVLSNTRELDRVPSTK